MIEPFVLIIFAILIILFQTSNKDTYVEKYSSRSANVKNSYATVPYYGPPWQLYGSAPYLYRYGYNPYFSW